MRITKFKAWDREHGMGKPFTLQEAIEDSDPGFHSTEGITYLQFTGLLDKNGKEIYEGDILATSNFGEPYTDEWNSKEFGYAKVTITPEQGVSFEGDDINWSWDDEESIYSIKYCEVIGNIYENPELLK